MSSRITATHLPERESSPCARLFRGLQKGVHLLDRRPEDRFPNAHDIVRAIEGREREVVMAARGKIGLWLKLLAPSLVDRIARRAIERGR